MTFDFGKAREAMVEQQVRPWDVLDPRVLEVLASLPRDAFVSETHRALAYADLALPIGHGEFMMKPVIEGRALQALALAPTETVLEIGTGSGFLTACLGRLSRSVTSLERHPEMVEAARARLSLQGVTNAIVEHADAFTWSSDQRFDAICVTAAADVVPSRFLQWLRPGGRMFIVRGRAPVMEAVLVHRDGGTDVNAHRIESLFETDLSYLAGAEPVPGFTF
jgi:protein-L-isoaspartate(D-aspartate) O-methyltransferase